MSYDESKMKQLQLRLQLYFRAELDLRATKYITTCKFKFCLIELFLQLAACAANQLLPMNPDLPADLFTACLTTPIKMALRWFVMQNQGKLAPRITLEMLDKIPGM